MPIEHWSDTIWLVTLANEPSLSNDLSGSAEQAAKTAPRPNVVLDLSGVDHLNSSNVSQLLRLRKVLVDGEGRLVLAGMSAPNRTVLTTMEIDRLFEFAPDVPMALAGLQIE